MALGLLLISTVPKSLWHDWLVHHQDHQFNPSDTSESFQPYHFNCGFTIDYLNVPFDIGPIHVEIPITIARTDKQKLNSLFFLDPVPSGRIPRAPPVVA